MLLVEDPDGTPKYYFQESGSMTVSYIDDPVNGQFTGTLSNIRLIEVTIDSSYVSTPVTGGDCLDIVSASFDTQVPTSGTCENVEDCLSASTHVCAPDTAACEAAVSSCSTGEVLLLQNSNITDGACYEECTVLSTTDVLLHRV